MFYQGATAAEMRAHTQPFHTPDPVSWGHMSSPDLTHWVRLPMPRPDMTPASIAGTPPPLAPRTVGPHMFQNVYSVIL